jgi:putative transmembrane protein PGPGW
MRRSSNPDLAVLVEYGRMIESAKENWRRFRQSKPGHRFQDHHHRCQRAYKSRSYLRGLFGIAWGLLVVIGGVIAVPAPGPGWLFILLGLGVIAGESLFFARSIDRVELSMRWLARLVVGIWTISPNIVMVMIALTVLSCATALGYGMYSVIFES